MASYWFFTTPYGGWEIILSLTGVTSGRAWERGV
jgi:hypothetical protein